MFVIGTGRCGSATFFQACRHITNYTTGHETTVRKIKNDFPDRHIEIAARLPIGTIIKNYPGSKWVHLIRERDSCVQSLITNGKEPLEHFIKYHKKTPIDLETTATLYYEWTNDNIKQMLKTERHITMHLEDIEWMEFWGFIGAEGNFCKSTIEWNRSIRN